MPQSMRPVMADQDYKSSTTYNGKDGFVARLEEALSWDQAGEAIRKEKGMTDEKPFHGISDVDTSITQRIANQTFQPTMDTTYRTQLVIQERLKNEAAQLKEDLARNKAYLKSMKDYL